MAKLPSLGETKGLLKDTHLDCERNVWARSPFQSAFRTRNCQETIVSLSCLSSCVSPEELSFEGQRGEFEYAHRVMEAALKLPFGQNNSMYSLAACKTGVGWDLEYAQEQDSPPGFCVAVSSRLFCKGPI